MAQVAPDPVPTGYTGGMFPFRPRLVPVVVLGLLTACGPPTVKGLAITATPAYVPAGRTVSVAAKATYADGHAEDVTAKAAWKVADAKVAGLAPGAGPGEILGVAPGTATVTARFQGVSGTLTLTVGRPVGGAGAVLPFVEYEAEDQQTNGTIIGPSRTLGDLAEEASGRRAVRLDATGQKVSLTTTAAANAIVIRYAIPDAPAGGGEDATLGLYVDGVRQQDLKLTSRYAWLYGGATNSANDTPGSGAHHFYDEVHARIGEVPAGATITLQKDAQDTAAWYVVDLVDLEEVAPAIPQPAGTLSITDYGATPDDGTDDAAAIQAALDDGKAQGKPVWIPTGRFDLTSAPLQVSGVTLEGAGMWYSTLGGPEAELRVSGSDNHLRDFALFGETTYRDDQHGRDGLDGALGTGSTLERLWIEHVKAALWIGVGTPLTDGLEVRGVRIRDTFADGVNLDAGTSHSVVEQSSFRNTGDDGVATWSPASDGPNAVGNVFRFDTVQAPWRANCFAVYGGQDTTLEDDLCTDTANYPGVLLASSFGAHAFAGTTTVARVSLLRAGGLFDGHDAGALWIHGDEQPIAGVEVQDLMIRDASYSGIEIGGPQAVTGVTFDNVQVVGAGAEGIRIGPQATGAAQATALVVAGSKTRGITNLAGSHFRLTRVKWDGGW